MGNGLSRRSSSRRQAESATCKASESDEPRLRLCRITCVQTVCPPLRLSVHLDHCGDGEPTPAATTGRTVVIGFVAIALILARAAETSRPAPASRVGQAARG